MYNHNRKKHPKYNDVEYHKSLLDEVVNWELIDKEIEESENAGGGAAEGRLSGLINLRNRINEVR